MPGADRIALDHLRSAVRADVGRTAMIYALPDLGAWVERSLARRGLRCSWRVTDDGELALLADEDATLGVLRTAIRTGRFDAAVGPA